MRHRKRLSAKGTVALRKPREAAKGVGVAWISRETDAEELGSEQ